MGCRAMGAGLVGGRRWAGRRWAGRRWAFFILDSSNASSVGAILRAYSDLLSVRALKDVVLQIVA